MIAKKNIEKIFYLFIFCHLFLWTLIPSISNLNLPLDTIEALAWGSNLDWGFNKHPPLSAFAVEIFYQILLGIIKNIVLFGMIIGIILNYSNLIVPSFMKQPLDIFVNIALPMVLISLGLALGNFKIRENIYGAILLTILKNFIHPIIAFCLAHFILELDSLLVIIVTMAAALPSGSQSYYFAYRYNSLKAVVSSNVVLSTFISFFTLSLLLVFFDIT